MTIKIGNNIILELNQAREKGTPWQVRTYKRVLGFRKQISSDWFLDEQQARKFVEQLAGELGTNRSTLMLKQRKPGWTLHRPIH